MLKLPLTLFICLIGLFVFSQSVDSLESNSLYNKILSLDQNVRNNPGKQVSNFNPSDTTSLPIGIVKEIGQIKYIICIDSAFFTPTGAYFNVYMAMHFPNADKPVAFAAKNIQFNPKGVIVSNGARLQLVSEQTVNLGPKTQLVFKDDGQNFIEWDCNGYKQAGLSLDFVFGDMLVHATNPSQPVKAGMQLVVADINNITFQLNQMDPFRIKGAKDMVFQLTNIVIDQSELQTPAGVNLPTQMAAVYGQDLSAWKGFYAQNAVVTLPEKLSSGGQPTQVYAQNLIIDDSGVSGSFGGNNILSIGQGSMGDSTNQTGKWGFSITNLQVDLVSNHVTGGSMSGKIAVAPLDDKQFNYSASITDVANEDYLAYNFSISPGNDSITVNAFKSKLVLQPCSQLSVASVGRTFVPTATLTGSWTLNESRAKVQGVQFQQLTITSTAPYITSGLFSLISNSNSNCVGLPVSLNSVGMSLTPQNQLQFSVGVGISLGAQNGTPSFGVNTTIRVVTQRAIDINGKDRITYNQFGVDDILINASTSAFQLAGVIAVRSNDQVFGNLFFGSISLSIPNLIETPVMVSAGFGKKNGAKYWFTDASIPGSIMAPPGVKGILVAPSVYITSLYGGVQNGVISTLNDQQLLNRVAGQITTPSATIPFTPDPTQGLLFRAGIALEGQNEKQLNGEMMLTLAFNPNGGFQSVSFLGQAYMLVKRSERQMANASKAWGTLSVAYNHVNKVFDAEFGAGLVVPSTLTGNLNIKIHIDTNDWYFWLNRPSNRASVNIGQIATVNAYFMIGTQIDPIPAPPSYVSGLVGGGSIGNIDLTAVGNGNGFATGMAFSVGVNGEFPKTTKWRGFVQVAVGAGFDVLMFDAQNATCAGSTSKIGVNGYYIVGQVYAYLNGSFGARRYGDDGAGDLTNQYDLGSLQVAALLQGKLPKPTFVYGAVGLQANVLGVINFGFTADVELGNNCTIVGI